MSVMLFRVDTLNLLYNMMKGPEALDKSSAVFKDWEELVKQILRKCFKKIEERPELLVEMLFSKLHGTAFFLEYGYEKQTSGAKSQPKPAAELVFKKTEQRDEQVGIVVGALLDKNQADHIDWLKKILTTAESERKSWQAANEAIIESEAPFDDDQIASQPQEAKLPPPFSKFFLPTVTRMLLITLQLFNQTPPRGGQPCSRTLIYAYS
jgi:replication fork protection complex subunit Tof1/Swi1